MLKRGFRQEQHGHDFVRPLTNNFRGGVPHSAWYHTEGRTRNYLHLRIFFPVCRKLFEYMDCCDEWDYRVSLHMAVLPTATCWGSKEGRWLCSCNTHKIPVLCVDLRNSSRIGAVWFKSVSARSIGIKHNCITISQGKTVNYIRQIIYGCITVAKKENFLLCNCLKAYCACKSKKYFFMTDNGWTKIRFLYELYRTLSASQTYQWRSIFRIYYPGLKTDPSVPVLWQGRDVALCGKAKSLKKGSVLIFKRTSRQR